MSSSGSWAGLVMLVLALEQCRAMEEGAAAAESSDAYLRNVVSELRLLNGDQHQHRSSAFYQATGEPVNVVAGSSLDRLAPGLPKYDIHAQVIQHPEYAQQEEAPTAPPLVLGFTAAELATMYKKALERGSPVKYNSLVSAINQPQQPAKIVSSPFAIGDETNRYRHQTTGDSQQYAYYFYPLNTFRHELNQPYGYRMTHNMNNDLASAENTKKETSTMNPIIIGVSSFLGMALFFMFSLFVYPRFMNYMHFPFVVTSRSALQNELAHLASFVTEAIEYYNKKVRKKSKRQSHSVQMR